jgi:PAS domain S-box-containing protein
MAAQSSQEAQKAYAQWLAHYKKVAADPEHGTLTSAIEKAGDSLRQRAEELSGLAASSASDADLTTVRQRLATARQRLGVVIEKAMRPELELLKEQKESLGRRVAQAEPVSMATAGGIGLVALVLGIWLSSSIAGPVSRLAQDAKAVGSGNLAWRTQVHSRDEIGQLAEAFNRMMESLERTTVSRRFVHNVISSMADALIVVNPDGTIRSVNRATVAMLGFTDTELIGQPIDRIFADRRSGASALDRAGMNDVIAAGTARNVERLWETKDRRQISVLCSGSSMVGEDGRLQGLVCVALDITERKQAEEALRRAYEDLQRAQQNLVQSEKLAALGRFAAGIAHEVKNPLSIVLGGIEYLQSHVGKENEDNATSLRMMKDAVGRADTIVRDLLKFARPSGLNREPVALDALVNETVALLKYGGSLKHVQAQTEFTHGATCVEVDKNQIQQVLLNVMMNAVDAMPQGGRLVVRTALTGDRALAAIEVADTGEGIAPENLERLFEPFFTTKRERKGTGLGLSIAKTIVEGHGGTVTVSSVLGKGTTVTVTLPAVKEAMAT